MENDKLLMVPLRSQDFDDATEDPDGDTKPKENQETAIEINETGSASEECDHNADKAVDKSYLVDETKSSCASLTSVMLDVCRICHCESEPTLPLISPCACAGSLKYVHQSCLQQWVKSADTKSCELCKYQFEMTTKVKPLRKWTTLDMSRGERRKIMCSVAFHIIAITCVIWSLYVLIDRTTDELRQDKLGWTFWTKLIVVAIGFTGGIVFMYVQCKMYGQLCRRWRAYNRVIFIENAPEKKRLPVDVPVKVKSFK